MKKYRSLAYSSKILFKLGLIGLSISLVLIGLFIVLFEHVRKPSVLIEIFFFISLYFFYLLFSAISSFSLTLGDKGFVLKCRKREKFIFYNDIKNVTIEKNKFYSIEKTKIFFKSELSFNKRFLLLLIISGALEPTIKLKNTMVLKLENTQEFYNKIKKKLEEKNG